MVVAAKEVHHASHHFAESSYGGLQRGSRTALDASLRAPARVLQCLEQTSSKELNSPRPKRKPDSLTAAQVCARSPKF